MSEAGLRCPISGSDVHRVVAERDGVTWVEFPASGFLCAIPAGADSPDGPLETARRIAAFETRWDRRARRTLRDARAFGRRLPKAGRVLDVGCGAGLFVAAADTLGLDAQGIDADPAMVAFARQRFSHLTFRAVDVAHFQPSGRFDGIHCADLLGATPDPLALAQRLHALLKPGGVLFLTLRAREDVLRDDRIIAAPDDADWRNYFSRRNIGDFLVRAGFTRVRRRLSLRGGLKVFAWK